MGTHSNPVRMSRISLWVVFFLAAAASAKQQVERHPKLFFVSTSSTTSTISTASVCYITTATGFAGACTGRKRRAINFEGGSSVFQGGLEFGQGGQIPALLDHHHLHLHLHLLHNHLQCLQCLLHPDWWQRVRLIYQLDLGVIFCNV